MNVDRIFELRLIRVELQHHRLFSSISLLGETKMRFPRKVASANRVATKHSFGVGFAKDVDILVRKDLAGFRASIAFKSLLLDPKGASGIHSHESDDNEEKLSPSL